MTMMPRRLKPAVNAAAWLTGFVTYLSLYIELPWSGHLNTTLEFHLLLGNHICFSKLLLTFIYCLAQLYITHTKYSDIVRFNLL